MKRLDFAIIAAALLIFAMGVLFWYPHNLLPNEDNNTQNPRFAEVSVEGEPVAVIPLDVRSSTVFDVEMGTLTVGVVDGHVSVTRADCPSQDCVRANPIGSRGGVIACLPNHVLVTVVEGDAKDGENSDPTDFGVDIIAK